MKPAERRSAALAAGRAASLPQARAVSGATDGGGRTAPDDGGRTFAPGGLAPAGGAGGRFGKLMRAVSFSTGTVGRFVVRGGRVMRTVSFFGSFRSAIAKFTLIAPGKTAMCLSNPVQGVNHQSPSGEQIIAAHAENLSPNELANRRGLGQNHPRVHLWRVGLGARDERLVDEQL